MFTSFSVFSSHYMWIIATSPISFPTFTLTAISFEMSDRCHCIISLILQNCFSKAFLANTSQLASQERLLLIPLHSWISICTTRKLKQMSTLRRFFSSLSVVSRSYMGLNGNPTNQICSIAIVCTTEEESFNLWLANSWKPKMRACMHRWLGGCTVNLLSTQLRMLKKNLKNDIIIF